jgi:hypothetical protein
VLPDVVNSSARRLFSSIIYKWEKNVNEHAYNNPLTEEELANVPTKIKRQEVP